MDENLRVLDEWGADARRYRIVGDTSKISSVRVQILFDNYWMDEVEVYQKRLMANRIIALKKQLETLQENLHG